MERLWAVLEIQKVMKEERMKATSEIDVAPKVVSLHFTNKEANDYLAKLASFRDTPFCTENKDFFYVTSYVPVSDFSKVELGKLLAKQYEYLWCVYAIPQSDFNVPHVSSIYFDLETALEKRKNLEHGFTRDKDLCLGVMWVFVLSCIKPEEVKQKDWKLLEY